MIEIKALSRRFGNIKAVDNISFGINAGEIVGFLGPNGAGKTTTMRMMVGYLQPDQGSIELEGKSIFANPLATSARIGYLPEHNPLYPQMRVAEFLAYIANLRRMPASLYQQRLDYVIENCGLEVVLNQEIGTLSKGFRQRVGLAQAILHDPDVLILDEPTSGLDPNQILEIRSLILELGQEKTVLLSSHIMQEVQALCDRVIIINKGSIVVDDQIENLGLYIGNKRYLTLEIEAVEPDFSDWFFLYPQTQLAEQKQHETSVTLKIVVPSELDLRKEISLFVSEKGWQLLGLYSEKQSLEEVFHSLTMEEHLPHPDEDPADPEDTQVDDMEDPQPTPQEDDTHSPQDEPTHEEEQ